MRLSFLLPFLSATLSAAVLVATIGASMGCSGACDVGDAVSPLVQVAAGLFLQAVGGPAGQVSAQLQFVEPGELDADVTCGSLQTAGACQAITCTTGLGGVVAGVGDEGTVVASVGSTTAPILYDGYGYASTAFPSSVTLGTGGTMMFQGGGGSSDVPSFDVCVTIPGVAELISPVPKTDGGAVVVDTSTDLAITWKPMEVGQLKFEITQSNEDILQQMTVSCVFDGASGAGVVPVALLSPLLQNASTTLTFASATSQTATVVVVDELTIATQGSQLSPSTLPSFPVTVQ